MLTKTLTAVAALALVLTAALPAQARLSMNGASLNGTSLNGIDPNGIDPNGIDPNGIDPNGIDPNGHQLNGLEAQGVDPRGTTVHQVPTPTATWVIGGAIVPQRGEEPVADRSTTPQGEAKVAGAIMEY